MSVQVTSLNTIKRDFSKDVYIHSKTHDQKPIIIMDMGATEMVMGLGMEIICLDIVII